MRASFLDGAVLVDREVHPVGGGQRAELVDLFLQRGDLVANEGTILLQIKEDGSYIVRMTPTPAANNIAKPASWSGTVVQNGGLVVFRTSQEPWAG